MYLKAGESNAAEDAYRQSLAISVQLGSISGQACSLFGLGNLFAKQDRLEEAALVYLTAADHFGAAGDILGQARCWGNRGIVLGKLRHWDEARGAIYRAIECEKPFGHEARTWKTWGFLIDVETGAGNPTAAKQARANAVSCYLTYRREGGENHSAAGRISLEVTTQLVAGDAVGAIASIDAYLADPELPGWLHTFAMALRAIAAGSRERHLADNPELSETSAAELLHLLDVLEHAQADHNLSV